MSKINLIITQKEELKEVIQECLDEHQISNDEREEKIEKPMSRTEIAEFLGISKVTVTDWMKKGLPYKRMNGRVYFIKSEVLDAMPSFNHRKSNFLDR